MKSCEYGPWASVIKLFSCLNYINNNLVLTKIMRIYAESCVNYTKIGLNNAKKVYKNGPDSVSIEVKVAKVVAFLGEARTYAKKVSTDKLAP